MLARSSEAAHLESDYLRRLQAVLAARPADERADILQDVKAHIEEALGETSIEPVTLLQMAAVIERLGAPESFVREAAAQASEPASQPYASATTNLAPDALPLARQVIDRVWWGELISTIALYIPLIDLEFCTIIGSLVIAQVLRTRGVRLNANLGTIGALELANAGIAGAMCIFTIASLFLRGIIVLALPLAIAAIAVTFVAYWWRQSIFATWMDGIGQKVVASTIRFRRTINVCVVAPAMILVLVVLSANIGSPTVAGFLGLPLIWISGYFLTLRPLAMASAALNQSIGTPVAASA